MYFRTVACELRLLQDLTVVNMLVMLLAVYERETLAGFVTTGF
jgi:hypothetical protein